MSRSKTVAQLTSLLVFATLSIHIANGQAPAGSGNQVAILTPPSLTTCQPVSVQWTNAAPGTVYISVHPSSDPYGPSIKDLPPLDASVGTYAWTVDIAPDQTVVFRITDAKGTSNASGIIPVRQGSSTSCISSAPPSSTPTNGAPAPAAGAKPSGAPAASGSPSTSTSTSSPATSGATGSASVSPSSSSGSSTTGAKANPPTPPTSSSTPSSSSNHTSTSNAGMPARMTDSSTMLLALTALFAFILSM